ncbi:MAG: hypothetical protein AABY18_00925 [Candidatus Thermoplasmatota archaeon]
MDDDSRLLASRRLAIAAFLLAATSLLLAWWRVTWSSGASALRDDVRLFRPEEPLTTAWGPWLTGAVVAVTLVLLFVRIAARSDRHEPTTWRRDLGVAVVLLALALASCMLWPADVPSFWGGRTYEGNITAGEPVTETAMPGLGWWVALTAALLLGGARLVARPTTDK